MTSGFNGRLSAALTSALFDTGVSLGPNTAYVCDKILQVVNAEVAAIVSNPDEITKAEADAKAFSDALASAATARDAAAAADAAKNSQAAVLDQARQALVAALNAMNALGTKTT